MSTATSPSPLYHPHQWQTKVQRTFAVFITLSTEIYTKSLIYILLVGPHSQPPHGSGAQLQPAWHHNGNSTTWGRQNPSHARSTNGSQEWLDGMGAGGAQNQSSHHFSAPQAHQMLPGGGQMHHQGAGGCNLRRPPTSRQNPPPTPPPMPLSKINVLYNLVLYVFLELKQNKYI